MKFKIFILFIAILTMYFDCTKDQNQNIKILTLEDKYPDWKNLTWISTDGNTGQSVYPKLEIKIIKDTITFSQYFDLFTSCNNTYFTMTINENSITIGNKENQINGQFAKNNDQITFITKGLIPITHTYVLKIN